MIIRLNAVLNWFYKINNRQQKLFTLFIPLFVFFLFQAANLKIGGPTIQLDEGSYLANAAVLAGSNLDQANSYHAGYSAFLIPAFLIGNNTHEIYFYVKMINSLLWAGCSLLLFNIVSCLFLYEAFYRRIVSTLIAILYPTWITISGYAFSESGYVFFYLLSTYLLIKTQSKGRWYWLLLALSVSYLYWIHPKAIPVILSVVICGLYIAYYNRNEWIWVLFFLVSMFVLVIFYKYGFQYWFYQTMTSGDFKPDSHYPSVDGVITKIFDVNNIRSFIGRLSGHLFYSIVGSIGLVFYAFYGVFLEFFNKIRSLESNEENYKTIYLFLILSYIGTLIMSAAFFTNSGANRLDHWMYGRYVEGVVLPLISIGFFYISRWPIVLAIIASGILAIMLSCSISTYLHTAPFNISAFWQEYFLREMSPIVWWLVGIIPIFFLFFLKFWLTQSIVLIAVFLSSSFLQIQWHMKSFNHISQRHELAKFIQENWTLKSCVGFDMNYKKDYHHEVFRSNYGFYLYNYNLRRLKIDNWYKNCDGPLISFSRNLDEKLKYIYPVNIEKEGGPLLWVKESDKPNLLLDLIKDDDFISVNPLSVPTHLLLDSGWHTVETNLVWSSQKSTIRILKSWFDLKKIPSEIRLEVSAFAASQNRPVDIFVSAIDFYRKITVKNQEKFQITIPLVGLIDNEKVVISLIIDGATSPSGLGLSNDSRIIGLALYRFLFFTGL